MDDGDGNMEADVSKEDNSGTSEDSERSILLSNFILVTTQYIDTNQGCYCCCVWLCFYSDLTLILMPICAIQLFLLSTPTNADSRPLMLYWKLVLSCPTRVTLHDLWALLPPSTICQQEIVAQNLVPNLASGWLAETVGRNLQLMFEIELFSF